MLAVLRSASPNLVLRSCFSFHRGGNPPLSTKGSSCLKKYVYRSVVVSVKRDAAKLTRKSSDRKRKFFSRLLTATRAGLRGILRINLVEVETVSFGYVPSPLKEGPPRSIADTLAEVFVLYHVRYA